MLTRLPKKYTVLIAGTGKPPIVLNLKPVPVLIAAGVLAALPLVVIGYLTHHSIQLARQNQELTQTANEVLGRLNALDTEIKALKQRAGLDENSNSNRTFNREAARQRAGLDEGEEDTEDESSGDQTNGSYGDSRGGPAIPIAAESLFELAQQRMPNLALSLEADVKPALEVTLAKEADREAAFPSGLPLKGEIAMSSEFGLRRNPFGGSNYEMHEGLDFKGPVGRPVYATAEGTVIYAESGNGYGKHVIINHGYGYETLYAHLSDFNVAAGDKVERGDLIGFLGSTGRSSGPHLHYGIYRNGQSVNPRYYLKLEDSGL